MIGLVTRLKHNRSNECERNRFFKLWLNRSHQLQSERQRMEMSHAPRWSSGFVVLALGAFEHKFLGVCRDGQVQSQFDAAQEVQPNDSKVGTAELTYDTASKSLT